MMDERRGGQVAEVLSALEESSIIEKGMVEDLAAAILAGGMRTREEATSYLVREGHLSSFQGEQLLAGRIDECVLSGRYHVLDRIGAGGMGAVYRAIDRKLDRIVAVKVLPAERLLDPAAVARFEREARALAKLSHPGIIQAYDSGADRGRHFLVMEYVEGMSLRDLIRKEGRLAPAVAADHLHQAARALEHAHARGLIHRDLKPSNILVTPGGEVKVLDLGLARFLQDQISDSRLTMEGMGMGTPDYMAPEQFRSARSADERSDIYALGCTLHEALSGDVPFPGSSLEEKARAHAEAEPRPLEEACPHCPSGLILAARRMMAKRPGERFRSARDAAEALAPYVSGSSRSFAAIRDEATWEGSRLAISLPARRRGRRAGVLAVAAALALGAGAAGYTLRPGTSVPAPETSTQAAPVTSPAAGSAEPGVILVAADGSGHHRTIADALAAARPRATIRVRAGTYRELLRITRASLHEGLTIEGEGAVTIEAPGSDARVLLLQDVPRVTVRGLTLRASTPVGPVASLGGRSPGVMIEGLDVSGGEAGLFLQPDLSGDDSPLVIARSRVRSLEMGIACVGAIQGGAAAPCRRVVIRDNLLEESRIGIYLLGAGLREVHVTGNRVLGASRCGIQLALLAREAGDILIANNTTLECGAGFRLWDGDVLGERIELSGNLFLGGGPQPDMVFIDSGGTMADARGPGDGRLLHERWSLRKNWREAIVSEGDDLMARSWVPAAASDVLSARIDVLSRDAASPDFLRPPAGSPLATGGLGGEDSAFPLYAGAVPPEGVEPWDWGKTWEARHPRKLITVSKDPAAGGDFRTISGALEKARPGVTIRVLDDATYTETILLRRRDIHSGITLEAPERATLEPEGGFLIGIIDIPGFTVRGFRLLSKHAPAGVTFHGRCSGALLEDLDITVTQDSSGISLELLDIREDEAPAVVRVCTVRGAAARGIRLSGIQDDYKTAAPCGRVAIHDNVFIDTAVGIVATGSLHEVILAGNRISGTGYAGIQLENLLEGTRNILIANNSFLACRHAIRLWDDGPSGRGIEIRGNVALGSWAPDMVFIDSGDSPQSIRGPGDGPALLGMWSWSRNWREGAPPAGDTTDEKSWIPAAPGDILRERIDGVLRDPKAPGYLRPLPGSPLATGGAGQDDPGLPPYAGAVPPEGVEPWDWGKTWEAWSARWAKK